MAGDHNPMNTFMLRRFISLTMVSAAALALISLLGATAAQAVEPPAPADTAASAAPTTAEETPDNSEDWNAHRPRRGHHRSGNDLVNIGHDSALPEGETADSVVSVFGSSTSDGNAGDVVSILGDTRVTGEVSDSAVAVLGNTYIDGKVAGDTVTVLGDLDLGPRADIGGDAVVVGGSVRRDPAAVIHGSVQNVLGGDFGSFGWLHAWVRHCLLYARPLAFANGLGWAWGLALACLALYVVLALLFREGLSRCVRTFETQPGHTVLAGLSAALLTPVLLVLLCVTVIGIAAVPFVVFTLICVSLFGKAVMLAWLGGRITGNSGTNTANHPAVAVLIGGAVVLVLYVVPILGFLVYKLLGFLGLGAVVYTLILALRANRAAKEGPSASTAPPRPASPPAGEVPAGSGAAAAQGPAFSTSSAAMAAGPAASEAAAGISAGASSHAGAGSDAGTRAGADAGAGAGPGAGAGASVGAGATAAAGAAAPPAAQPITAALPRAGFWIRMGALFLDVLLVGCVLSVLRAHQHDFELVVLATYGAVMWKVRGSTIGGIVFDLRVVRLDGRVVDWETAIVRALSCFLSMVVAGLGFFWIAFDENHQAWHDKIAGTVVVRVPKGVPLV
jgi:uncharacterized RDD family membrane protein YckC